MPRSLTYALLDELEVACEGGALSLKEPALEIRSLGPLIQLQRSREVAAINAATRIEFGAFAPAAEFLKAPAGLWINKTGTFGLAASSAEGEAALELMQRALLSLSKTSFPKDAAAQAVSALGELDSNIQEHSGDRERGITAFELGAGFLGIYSSDLGVGVLNSLRRNPAFEALDDSGEALMLAVQEGVSSFEDPGRGKGFRPIFVGLASLSALLRFRSGDSVLEINGFGDGVPCQDVKERSSIPGFHAFIHCAFGK
ncbi:MAG TPA: hypothetical protein VEZ70_03280 [Allosphingosinicella sp.]|nr:hypothetical protein [Allosphingosinicella sp.]